MLADDRLVWRPLCQFIEVKSGPRGWACRSLGSTPTCCISILPHLHRKAVLEASRNLIGSKVAATATATTPNMSKGHFIFNSIMRSSADVSLASHCGSLAIAAPPVLPSPTLASVSCGMVRRVFTARKRPVEFEVLYAPPPIRSWGGVGGSGHLIIRPAIPIQRSAMMGRLSEHRRSNGGAENYYST